MDFSKILYLDNASTTKVDQRVIEAMLPYFTELYGNASSNHAFGKKAKEAVEEARHSVASLLNCDDHEIIFTSGATESINFALKGYVEANYEKGNHIITVKTEHKAVLATCEYLETKGVEVTYLDVDQNGLISLEQLESAIRQDTLMICVMYVNNETGVIQPIKAIGQIANAHNIVFFCDATQAVGKIPVDVQDDGIDMLCFSGHKINGPKGIGALYKRRGIELTPLIHGGGQENGLRAGTYNTPLIVGLGKACECKSNIDNHLITKAIVESSNIAIIANHLSRVNYIFPVILNFSNIDAVISNSNEIMISNGSACTSEIIESSHVLKAMGFTDEECKKYVRLSGNDITQEIIEMVQDKIKKSII